jgi:oligoribonuclease
MLPTPRADHLVWIDLEMTGLDPSVDVVMQAALVITTADLEPLDEVSVDVGQSEATLARMSPFVRDMHTRTGLVERVLRSRVDIAEAERRLVACVGAWCPPPATLCGNSIWNDRRFIARYMPALDGHLHYRVVDVSSVKVLAERWYGEAAVFAKPTAGAHDATVDVKHSIAELRHYRETLFRARPAQPSGSGDQTTTSS